MNSLGGPVTAMVDCATCRQQRYPFRNLPVEGSYWHPLLDVLPEPAVRAMFVASLCATHHGTGQRDESAALAGVRALVAWYESQDVVPRSELNDRLGACWEALQVAERRVGNVEKLVSAAGKRKTMRTEEVRAAVEVD